MIDKEVKEMTWEELVEFARKNPLVINKREISIIIDCQYLITFRQSGIISVWDEERQEDCYLAFNRSYKQMKAIIENLL